MFYLNGILSHPHPLLKFCLQEFWQLKVTGCDPLSIAHLSSLQIFTGQRETGSVNTVASFLDQNVSHGEAAERQAMLLPSRVDCAPELCPLLQPENTALQNGSFPPQAGQTPPTFSGEHLNSTEVYTHLKSLFSITTSYSASMILAAVSCPRKFAEVSVEGNVSLHILYCFAIRHRMVLKGFVLVSTLETKSP